MNIEMLILGFQISKALTVLGIGLMVCGAGFRNLQIALSGWVIGMLLPTLFVCIVAINQGLGELPPWYAQQMFYDILASILCLAAVVFVRYRVR